MLRNGFIVSAMSDNRPGAIGPPLPSVTEPRLARNPLLASVPASHALTVFDTSNFISSPVYGWAVKLDSTVESKLGIAPVGVHAPVIRCTLIWCGSVPARYQAAVNPSCAESTRPAGMPDRLNCTAAR